MKEINRIFFKVVVVVVMLTTKALSQTTTSTTDTTPTTPTTDKTSTTPTTPTTDKTSTTDTTPTTSTTDKTSTTPKIEVKEATYGFYPWNFATINYRGVRITFNYNVPLESIKNAHLSLLRNQPNLRAVSKFCGLERTEVSNITFGKGTIAIFILAHGKYVKNKLRLENYEKYFEQKRVVERKNFVMIILKAKHKFSKTRSIRYIWPDFVYKRGFVHVFLKTAFRIELRESKRYIQMNAQSELELKMVTSGEWSYTLHRTYTGSAGYEVCEEVTQGDFPVRISKPSSHVFLDIHNSYAIFSTPTYLFGRHEVYWEGDKVVWNHVEKEDLCRGVQFEVCDFFYLNVTYKYSQDKCVFTLVYKSKPSSFYIGDIYYDYNDEIDDYFKNDYDSEDDNNTDKVDKDNSNKDDKKDEDEDDEDDEDDNMKEKYEGVETSTIDPLNADDEYILQEIDYTSDYSQNFDEFGYNEYPHECCIRMRLDSNSTPLYLKELYNFTKALNAIKVHHTYRIYGDYPEDHPNARDTDLLAENTDPLAEDNNLVSNNNSPVGDDAVPVRADLAMMFCGMLLKLVFL